MPCGIWIGLDVADIIFYDASAPDILKIHIVLHEVAHMLLGHVAPRMAPTADATPEEVDRVGEHFQRLLATACQAVGALDGLALPITALARAEAARLRSLAASRTPLDDELGLSTDRIVSLLGRTKFDDRQEADAETLATIILERASRNEARSTSHEAADVLFRLNDAFGHPVRDR